jgi:hypothetical protein
MYVHVAVLKGAQVRARTARGVGAPSAAARLIKLGHQAVATNHMVYGDAPGRFGEDD